MATTHATANDCETSTMDNKNGDKFEDVELIVEGKKIRANSGILAYNSPVFASLLRGYGGTQGGRVSETERHIHMRYPSSRYEFRSESSKAVQTRIGEPIMELMIPTYKYKDIKKTLSYLMDKDGKRTMSGETAWRLLPIAEEYKLKSIKKKCGDALLKSLQSMREEKEIGNISVRDVFKHLVCAEKYGFTKIQSFCIDECAANFHMKRRKEVIDDKHIQDLTKIKILDKMCENMTWDYENRLQGLKTENDRRYTEIDKKLKQEKEVTDNWKEDMQQEVDAILTEAKKAHKQLVEGLERKRVISAVEEQLKQLTEDLTYEVGQMKDQIQLLIESVTDAKKNDQLFVDNTTDAMNVNQVLDESVTDAKTKDEQSQRALDPVVASLIQTFEETLETSALHIEGVGDRFERYITARLQRCPLEQIETGLGNNFQLQDNFDRLIAENAVKEQSVSDANYMVEKIRLDHEKTKAELRKYTKKFSRVNTWIKWATPVEEDEDKCLCYRHVTFRSPNN